MVVFWTRLCSGFCWCIIYFSLSVYSLVEQMQTRRKEVWWGRIKSVLQLHFSYFTWNSGNKVKKLLLFVVLFFNVHCERSCSTEYAEIDQKVRDYSLYCIFYIVYNIKSIGLSTEPCGTPQVTFSYLLIRRRGFFIVEVVLCWN